MSETDLKKSSRKLPPLVSWLQHLDRSGVVESTLLIRLGRAMLLSPAATESLLDESDTRTVLGKECCELSFENALILASRFQEVSSRHTSFAKESHSADELNQCLRAERTHLHALAFSKLGNTQTAGSLWTSLYFFPMQNENYRHALIAKFKVEEATALLNRGHFLRSFESLENILSDYADSLDLLTQLNALAVQDIALNVLGRYREADAVTQRHSELRSAIVSPYFEFSAMRRRVLACLEREYFPEANTLVQNALASSELPTTSRALLLQLKTDLQLVQNELREAEHSIKVIQDLLKQQPLTRGVINIEEEECELLLRKKEPESALGFVNSILNDARERSDVYAEFKGKLYLGRALAQLEKYELASDALQEALHLADDMALGTLRLECLFHLIGVLFAAEENIKLEIYLAKAQDLAEELNLPMREKCLRYIETILHNPQKGLVSALLELGSAENEVSFYLEFYGILKAQKFFVRSTQGNAAQSESDLRKLVLKTKGHFYFKRERTLVSNDGRKVHKLVLGSTAEKDLLLNQLLNTFGGYSMEELHKFSHDSEYHPHKHGSRLKTTIGRLRNTLENHALQLSYDRDSGRYSLNSQSPRYIIESSHTNRKTSSNQRADASRELKNRIVQAVQSSGRASTQEISKTLAMSRQALHPHLKKLERDGVILLKKRGRSSFYIFKGMR